MKRRRLAFTFFAATLAVVGTALFAYGVMFVEDPLIGVGIGLIIGGVLFALGAATQPWPRAPMAIVVLVMLLPCAFVVWVIWTLAHQST
jgi:hypothetical protein